MKPRIAIPVPLSRDAKYSGRAIPQYVHAVESVGGEFLVISLDQSPSEVARLVSGCQGVLLPGSAADVDPAKYGEARGAQTNDPDPARDTVDELLIQDAFNMRKPLLGICYGLQILNVWHTGSLVQHLDTGVKHTAGREVPKAHEVTIAPDSRLAKITGANGSLAVNSSHHQAVKVAGSGLRVVARSSADNVIEAVELVDGDHWVLGVQWHPERGYDDDPASQAIFKSFLDAARAWKPQPQKT